MEVGLIYSELRNALLAFIKGKISSKEDAEDILQNVFVKISMHIDSLGDEKKLTSWIYTIARNAITDYYRANASNRTGRLDDNISVSLADENQTDDTGGLDKCLGGMIAQLPADYKSIITDSEIKGIKQKDLAEKYNMAYPTVRSKVQRGRERLKQLLTNCCNIEADRHGNIMEATKKKGCDDACNSCTE